jgi:Mg-chelatase subunit ChlD
VNVDWIKRTFDGIGLTQYPPGKHLKALEERFQGTVILCLDVSGSMYGDRLVQAKVGCRQFITEAVAARYSVGGVLWHHGIEASSRPDRDRSAADQLFANAHASGGNDIVPTLQLCERYLDGLRGDLVVAIFGDGDLGPKDPAVREANRLAQKGIRVITCGLGDASSIELSAISTETSTPRSATDSDIAGAIAGMTSGLRRG